MDMWSGPRSARAPRHCRGSAWWHWWSFVRGRGPSLRLPPADTEMRPPAASQSRCYRPVSARRGRRRAAPARTRRCRGIEPPRARASRAL